MAQRILGQESVDELAIGSVDQFHGAVATAAKKPFAIDCKGSCENPVAVIVELEQLLAVFNGQNADTLVGTTDSDAVTFRREGKAVD